MKDQKRALEVVAEARRCLRECGRSPLGSPYCVLSGIAPGRWRNRDAGPGSLRDAVSQGNRRVVFDVAGDIRLARDIYVRGAFITIDGLSAPSPGITLKNHGLIVRGNQGAHDVIIRGLRIRGSIGCDTCNSAEMGRRRAIYMCHAGSKPPQCDGTNPQWFARAYIADNVSGHGPDITAYLSSLGTESRPFPAPPVETTDACTAA